MSYFSFPISGNRAPSSDTGHGVGLGLELDWFVGALEFRSDSSSEEILGSEMECFSFLLFSVWVSFYFRIGFIQSCLQVGLSEPDVKLKIEKKNKHKLNGVL